MTGPATKMYLRMKYLADAGVLNPDVLAGVIPAQLEAMDAAAAAEEWARQHEEEVADLMTIIFRDRPADQYMVLLAAALRMVAQERKEAGNGHA